MCKWCKSQDFVTKDLVIKPLCHGKRGETRRVSRGCMSVTSYYLMAFAQTRVSKFQCAKQHVVDDVHHTIGS